MAANDPSIYATARILRRYIIWTCMVFLSGAFRQRAASALEPNQVIVIANTQMEQSLKAAQHYCAKRNVPAENVLALPLGTQLADTISRGDYQVRLAEPIRARLRGGDGTIKCLLMVYGVPYKVAGRGMLNEQGDKLKELKLLLEQEKDKLGQDVTPADNNGSEHTQQSDHLITHLQSQIDLIEGRETDASVDSELSMVLCGPYELYRWQPNRLNKDAGENDANTIMVCRLDGPDAEIAMRLVDKAIAGERNGLKGTACIDSRGIENSSKPSVLARYDQSLRELAVIAKFRTSLIVKEERTSKLFEAGACPDTAIYCGWYSLRKYVDAFDFVDGAIGFHIASFEAVQLHDPNSTQWCPAMLKDGVTATIGAVAEPYLHSFPLPKDFFLELFEGRCLVEAYYRTAPFNSWRLVLIGDPLYTPFKVNHRAGPL